MKPRTVDQNMFNTIKILRGAGKTIAETAELTGLSKATVQRIAKAPDLAAYFSENAASSRKYAHTPAPACTPAKTPENAPVRVPAVTSAGTFYSMRLIELLTQQNEVLTSISNKLAFIVEQLA